jgi:CBS domain-containing protein
MSKTLVQALSTRVCYTINLNTILPTAIKELVDNKIGALPVVDTNGFLKGIISERDIIREIHFHGTIESLTVERVMTKRVITCSLEASANEIMELMTVNKIRHVPIMDKSTLLGVVSIGDVVSRLLSKYKFEAETLKNYINS